jgi:alpha-tubulin suppressor-like RCC1 family protein
MEVLVESVLQEEAKMKPKAFKVISLTLILVILSTMFAFASPVSAATNPVWAWGINDYGQLGYSLILYATEPVQVSGLTGVVAINGSLVNSLALKKDGTVWAWGDNTYYQQGLPVSVARPEDNTPESGVGGGYNLYTHGTGFPVPGDNHRLVQPLCHLLAAIQYT